MIMIENLMMPKNYFCNLKKQGVDTGQKKMD